MSQYDLEQLSVGPPASRWLSQQAQRWFQLWHWVLGTEGVFPFDALAVGYLTGAQQFQCEVLPARIATARRWLFTTYQTLEVSPHFEGAPEVTYCYNVAPEFKADMMARLLLG
jgi:hypothetical protein